MIRLPSHIVLIAKHIGINSGGEAIKAFQFAELLIKQGVAVTVVTHQRAMDHQGAGALDADFLVVPDTGFQRALWTISPLRGLLDIHFHIAARRLILKNIPPSTDVSLQYIAPVSPVMPRFLPKGYDIVVGPLTGNIFYPKAFRSRASLKFRIAEQLHALAQNTLGLVFPEKRKARVVLVSGYERTRASLKMAGVRDEQMVDVVDSGVSDLIGKRPRLTHSGVNTRFVCSGRMVDHKGTDFAIKAIAESAPDITLDIFGDGEKRAEHEALVARLGLQDRVRFLGWAPDHDALLDAFSEYRGYLFPTIAEANGIVMQEAMMVGLPVIATRWGGPAMLADDDSAVYVEPEGESKMVSALAAAMERLARDPDLAERLSSNARKIAQDRYSWDAVSESWLSAGYGTRPAA
jgi:glycosyltransferase involved in cell wall biosynthesis